MDLLTFSQILFYMSGAVAFWLVIFAAVFGAMAISKLVQHIQEKSDALHRQLEQVGRFVGRVRAITQFFKR